MGGLGKTTLAQLVYKDKGVENHFQPLIWVCVSDEFEVAKLAKAIITSATGEECNISTMELLQRRLREVLSGKRYFLVLDDVWTNDWEKWNGLKTLLETGKEGSKIIVTTRLEEVARIMGTIPPHYPQQLNENDSWILFKKRAFRDGGEEPQNLVSIGKDIVKKCDGLPLAVNVVGALMHSKSQEAEWLSVKNSEIWNLPAGDKILSVLRLSYCDLPSYLKQCFAFCAIFPKDHVMEKEMLIQLWMANGFIPSDDEGKELQDKGNEIFNELAWRSFFQDIKEAEKYYMYIESDEPYYKTTCKMHDLMHDLAQSVMGNECLSSLVNVRWEHISHKTPHLYIPPNSQLDRERTLNNFPNIRTLLMPNWSSRVVVIGDSLKSMSLRAWKLNDANITQLFNAIRFLKHLRYLDLTNTPIEALPEATSTLFNLQTLKLSRCWLLRKLPDGMKNMSNLRHLYIDECLSLKCLPTSMGQLRNLRTLTKYIVGNENGRRIDELNGLNLGGELQLYNLINVKNAAEAKEADLNSKYNLCSLTLCWDVVCYEGEYVDIASIENAKEVLEGLRPHVGLKRLIILYYKGTSFSMWMKDPRLLQNLVEIRLEFCTDCEHLPPLWQSRSLKFLYLMEMDKTKYICSSNESNGTVQPFPSLKCLVLQNMQSLKAWSKDEGIAEVTLVFPCLAHLEIIDCPNLMTMPELPSLKYLIMKGMHIQLGLVGSLTTLYSLRIDVSTDTQPPSLSQKKLSFRFFKSLKNLYIVGFKEDLASLLEEEETRGLSTSLHHLEVKNCNGLFSSSQQSLSPFGFWKNLASLQSLRLDCCDDMNYWPEEEFRGLSSLKSLCIYNCKNLIGPSLLPSSSSSLEDEELLPNLEELRIVDCYNLLKLPKLPTSLISFDVFHCYELSSLMEGGLQHITALESLHIDHCMRLASLPEDLSPLTALQRLQITNCARLTSLPKGLQQRLPGLRYFFIEGCPKLRRWVGGLDRKEASEFPYSGVISERSNCSTFLPSFCCFRRLFTL